MTATESSTLPAMTVAPPSTELTQMQSGGENGFSTLLDPAKFEHLQRVAKMYAESKMVPEHYRKQTADCAIAIQMAIRLGVDPFMFLQNTYTIKGKPGMEAKLMIALANSRGPFRQPIQYKLEGEPGSDRRRATAWFVHKSSGLRYEQSVDVAMAKAEGWFRNEKWRTMTDLMLQYRAAAFLIRLHCPETVMGMHTREELEDMDFKTVANRGQATTARKILDTMGVKPDSEPLEGQVLGEPSTQDSEVAPNPFEPVPVVGKMPLPPTASSKPETSQDPNGTESTLIQYVEKYDVTSRVAKNRLNEFSKKMYRGKSISELSPAEIKSLEYNISEGKVPPDKNLGK